MTGLGGGPAVRLAQRNALEPRQRQTQDPRRSGWYIRLFGFLPPLGVRGRMRPLLD
jgi:hypothetical protein